jgi:uncharacterized protein YoxC
MQLDRIERTQKKIMATVSDLDTTIETLTADFATFSSTITSVLAALVEKANSATVDLSPEIAKLQALDAALGTLTGTVNADNPAAPPAA